MTKKGKLIEFSPFNTGVWILDSIEGEQMSLEHHVRCLLLLLYPLKDRLVELSLGGYKMDLFCGAFIHGVDQPGFDLSPDVLIRLGELNVTLGLCIYQ